MPVGMKQRVEILKALFRDVSILILDEPTSVLAPTEVAPFLKGVRKLVANGCLVFFISHKLDEIRAIADRVMIMRHGRVEGVLPVATTAMAQMSALMMGEKSTGETVEAPKVKKARNDTSSATDALVVSDVCLTDPGGAAILQDVTLSVKAGEILGIAGIDGNGQTELSEVITGLRRQTSGAVTLVARRYQAPPSLLALHLVLASCPRTAMPRVWSCRSVSKKIWPFDPLAKTSSCPAV